MLVCPTCGGKWFFNAGKSFADGSVALDCAGCDKRVSVRGSVDIMVHGSTSLIQERVRHDPEAVTRRAKLEGSLNDDKHVNIQFRVPAGVRERAKLAFALAKVVNEVPGKSAWPEQCFEGIVEDYILGNLGQVEGVDFSMDENGIYTVTIAEGAIPVREARDGGG